MFNRTRQIHPNNFIKSTCWKVKSSKTIKRLIEEYLRSEHAKAQGNAPWFNDVGVHLGSWEFGIGMVANTNLYIEKLHIHGAQHDPILDRLVPMLAYIRANIANATERMAIDAMYNKISQVVYYNRGYIFSGAFNFEAWNTKFFAATN